MYYLNIASGSKGNATLVIEKNTVILIDLGVTLLRLNEGLLEVGKTLKDIDAVVYTHNHSDHINGLKAISPKKMFALKGTLPSSLSNTIDLYTPFEIGDITITAVKTSHDATNPCGYVLEGKKEKLTYITDTGYFVDESLPYVSNPDYLILECNHDIKMLMESSRPMILKQRILSEHGHLCNEDSAFASLEIIGNKTKEILLAHISEECNTPELAIEAYKKVFNYKGVDINKYKVTVANQWHSTLGGNLNEN